ncbi:MAG: M48 family metalloprotease [Fimbriimonadaceae bacterium]|nr:M48 family metalloprotease [Fimbriimonadaceae bacterium]
MLRTTRLFTILTVATALAGTAASDPFKPSAKDQVQLGQKVADQIRKEEKVLPDSDKRVKFLRQLGAKLLAANPDDKKAVWQYSFDVIESKDVNAFALPGGPVFFYTGLLDKLETEDQVAAIVGHELTHVRKEHWANQYAKSQKESLLLNLALILGKANNTVAQLSHLGREVFNDLRYSRNDETTSDEVGMAMMVKAGFNPRGMADTFRVLQKAGGSAKGWEFLSSHPDTERRIKRVEENIAKLDKKFPPQKPLDLPKSKYKGDYVLDGTSMGTTYAMLSRYSNRNRLDWLSTGYRYWRW